MKSTRILVFFIIVAGITISSVLAGDMPEHQIPVILKASPANKSFTGNEPLTIYLTIDNGLKGPIQFSTFSLIPNDWNGETVNCSLVDIYRNGEKSQLYLSRPYCVPPLTISGMSSKGIQSGESLMIQLDCRKWNIRGGWVPGTYEITTRVENIQVDSFISLDILSKPVRFTIK